MVRSRARFRGQRESFKINTEIAQTTYDLRRLYEKYQTIEEKLDLRLETLERGGNVGQALNGTNKALVLDGVESLADRIFRLEKRVRDLEYGGELT